ncbi:MAG: hypothetical protein HP495_18050, partial [Nitrospira sp.]|nr:hypothetical protein [Nitrospira sp.]
KRFLCDKVGVTEKQIQVIYNGVPPAQVVMDEEVQTCKAELAIVRERTVAEQGYDSFLEPIVQSRASEIMNEVVTEEMKQRSQRLIAVAADMLLSQGVAKRSDDRGIRSLRARLTESFHKGRIHGYASALELFYERR